MRRAHRGNVIPMLFAQSLGGKIVDKSHDGQPFMTAAQAWQAAKWHGGTVAIFPGAGQFELAANEMAAAMEAEKPDGR